MLGPWQKKRSWDSRLLLFFSLISSIKDVSGSFSNGDKTGNEGNLLVYISVLEINTYIKFCKESTDFLDLTPDFCKAVEQLLLLEKASPRNRLHCWKRSR